MNLACSFRLTNPDDECAWLRDFADIAGVGQEEAERACRAHAAEISVVVPIVTGRI